MSSVTSQDSSLAILWGRKSCSMCGLPHLFTFALPFSPIVPWAHLEDELPSLTPSWRWPF